MHKFSASIPALVSALEDDPFYRTITIEAPGVPLQRMMLLQYFEYSLQEADRTGRCVVLDDPTMGAAAWLLPRSAETEESESVAKAEFFSKLLGSKGWDAYRSVVDFMKPRAADAVPKDAWYLSILGVAPGLQGQGIGGRLLAPTLAEASDAGACAYLETFSPRSVPFYERLGFRLAAEHDEPTTGSPYAILRRDA